MRDYRARKRPRNYLHPKHPSSLISSITAPHLQIGGQDRMTQSITLTINGNKYTHEVEPRLLLIHYIREVVGLTGPHIGCETSLCGACTIEMDGRAVKSCTMFTVQADGANLTTIEGLAVDGKLHAMQEAFWNEHGAQCG